MGEKAMMYMEKLCGIEHIDFRVKSQESRVKSQESRVKIED